MRDDVVELACDSLAFLGDGALGRRSVLQLDLPRALRQLTRVLGAATQDESRRPRDADDSRVVHGDDMGGSVTGRLEPLM